MIKKVLFTVIFALVAVAGFGANPLSDYVGDDVYTEGLRKFPPGEDIFKTQVYSMEGVDKAREEAVARMNGIFGEITALTGTGTGWVTSFYYSEGGQKKRKTVMGTESLRVDSNTYNVTATSEGIRVRDMKTGYEITVAKKQRGSGR